MNRHIELTFIGEKGASQSAASDLGEEIPPFVIGSSVGAGLRIRAPGIAAEHCKISLNPAGEVQLVHLATTGAGTLCNGERVKTAVLNDGDRIAIGTTEMIVLIDRPVSNSSRAEDNATLAEIEEPSAQRSSSGLRRGTRAEFRPPQTADPLIGRAISELERAYPDRVSAQTPEQRKSLLERGCEQARIYGFEEPEQILRYLHCVFLLNNDLSKPTNSDVAYVIDTLTVPNKPAARRLDRALNLARRAAPPAPSAVPPPEPVASVAEPAAPPAAPSRRRIQPAVSSPQEAETIGEVESAPKLSTGPFLSGPPPVTAVDPSVELKRPNPSITRPSSRPPRKAQQ